METIGIAFRFEFFCHFSILFSAAKIYNYLNYSILFLVKKLMFPRRNHPKTDLQGARGLGSM